MRRLLAATALAGLTVLGSASLAQAQTPTPSPCENYSTGCEEPGDEVKPKDQVKGVKKVLPFTGGEITLLALTGAGTVAGGSALVLAGRRRTHKA